MKPKQLLKFFALLLCVVVVDTTASFISVALDRVTSNTSIGANLAASAVLQAVESTNRESTNTAAQISTSSLVISGFGDPPGNATHGTVNPNMYNYLRIGLAYLKNEPVEITTDPVQYSRNIQEYASKYYVRAFGPCYYYNLGSATELYADRDGFGLNVVKATPEQCPGCYKVLQAISTNTQNEFVEWDEASRSFYIKPDAKIITQLMDELCYMDPDTMAAAQANLNLRNMYNEIFTANSSKTTPVVIVIEPCLAVADTDGCYIASVADMVYKIGGLEAFNKFLETDLNKYKNEVILDTRNQPVSVSLTDKAFSDITGIRNDKKGSGGEVPWRGWVTKRFFGTRWHDGRVDIGTNNRVFAKVAHNAWQTLSDGGRDTDIVGCTVIAIASRDITDPVPPGNPEGNAPTGKYDWHIDAEDAVRNASGHREDQIVKTSLSFDSPIHKGVSVGALNLYQDNSFEWENWIEALGATEVTLQVGVYHTSGNKFSDDAAAIRADGASRTGNGVEGSIAQAPLSGDSTILSCTMPKEQFYKFIKDKDCSIPISIDAVGPSFTNGRLAVSYATTVSVVVNGKVVNLVNEDTHYIVYTADEKRTYAFQQIASVSSAQIKQGGLGTERYEAMAGTPTTEDLFITWGGDQYIVNMQFSFSSY